MFKNNSKERGFFLKILRSTVLLSITLLITLAGFFFINFRNHSLNQIYNFNKDLLEKTSKNIEKINLNTTFYVKSIFQNISAQRLMYNRSDELNELLNDIQSVEKILASNPYVHSIYIYNSDIDTFFIFGVKTLVRKGRIYDSEVINLLKDDKIVSNYPIPRKIPYSENKENEIVNAYSYVLKGEKKSETQMPYGVIVNIYSEVLFSSHDSSDKNVFEPGEVFSINTSGQINGSSYTDEFLDNVSGEAFFRKVISQKGKSGYFISNNDGKKELVSYVESSMLDWIFINKTPYAYINGLLRKIIIISLWLFGIILIGAAISAYYLSKKLYSPIDKLKSVLQKNDFNDTLGFRQIRELKSIAEDYENMYNELGGLENYKKRSLQHEKNRLINNIMVNVVSGKKEIYDLFKEYEINLDFSKPTILFILKIDNYEKNFSRRFSRQDQFLYKFALNNMTKEIVSKFYPLCESVDSGYDYTTTIISLDINNLDYSKVITQLQGCIETVQKEFYKFAEISVSGFISKIADNLFTISEEYNETLELTKQRLIYGHRCILTPEDYGYTHMGFNIKEDKYIEEILEALKVSNYNKAKENYGHIIEKIQYGDYHTIVYTAVYLNSLIMNTITVMEKNMEIEFDIDFLAINEHLVKCETLDEINKVFDGIFLEIKNKLDDLKDNKNSSYIQQINDYIEKNYMFDTLSSVEIANKIGLSQSYVNRIYRRNSCMSVSNYIKQIRLEKAAQLILETDYSIDKILERVGWTTKEYFYSSFKKCFGVTPGDYKTKN